MRVMIAVVAVAVMGALTGSTRAEEAAGAAAAAQAKPSLAKARKLAAEGKDAEAVAAYGAVLKAEPESHQALAELGYVHAKLKQWGAAAKYLKAASDQDPAEMRLHMDLGYVYQSLKQPGAAAREFDVVAKQPGEFQQQAEAALASTGVTPQAGDAKAGKLVEDAYASIRKGDKASARRKLQAALKIEPKNPTALKQLGFLDLEQGRLEQAAADFESARAASPDDYFVALQLGYTYDRLKKKEQAREAYGAALASSDPKIHDAAEAALKPFGGSPVPQVPAVPSQEAPVPARSL